LSFFTHFADFQNSVTDSPSGKFATNSSIRIASLYSHRVAYAILRNLIQWSCIVGLPKLLSWNSVFIIHWQPKNWKNVIVVKQFAKLT